MHEIIQQALTHLRGMWHRRWIGLAVAWLAAIIGVAVATRIPERYEASARVFVDTQSLLRPLMEGLSIQPNVDQQVAMMSRTLLSRPTVEKLVRMADLDAGITTEPDRAALIEGVAKGLQLTGGMGGPSSNIYTITYKDSEPERARKVVQSLLTIFMETSLGDKRQDTRTAFRFVDEQIKQFEESLKASEDRLKEFRLKYLGVAAQPGGTDYFGRLAKLSEDIAVAKRDLEAATQARDSYKRELAGESPVLMPEGRTAASKPAALSVPSIDGRLATLKGDLDTLLRRYTDNHPDVVGTKRLIAQLEEQRQAELDAMSKAAAAVGVPVEPSNDRNPLYQQLRFSVAEAEANVASLRAKLASYQVQYDQLKSAARMVPQVEAEFAQLNRDYGIQKKTYETLLARRQSATIGEGVQDAGVAQFRVVDPPRVSSQPAPPTRIMLFAAAFVAAIGAGVAASFLASLLMPTVHDARSLREISGRPVLGMVTMLPSAALARIRRRGAVLFAGGVSGLLATFVAVMAFALLMGRAA